MKQYTSGPVAWPEQPQTPAPPGVPAKVAKPRARGKKIANSLVALSSAAIVSVYGLGYVHTQSAEDQLTTNIAAGNTPVAIATAAPTATTAPPAAAQAPGINFPFPRSGSTSPISRASRAQNTPPPTATPSPGAAAAAATNAPATATAATTAYKDGSYTGTGTSRHGSITASLVIQGGKIVSANITQCGTRYPCSMVSSLPGEVVARQSGNIDFVSGATDSSTAYQGAIMSALRKASAG
jgi:uncharacterized protein with FMN-binding domain